MDMQKLLIADGSEDFRIALADALEGIYYVRSCATGREAISMLRSFNPDILVVNLMLQEIDGISLLEAAVREDIRPMVLATIPFKNDYILDTLDRIGVDYAMQRPCEIPAVVARVRDLSRRLDPYGVTSPDSETQVANLLLSLGIPTRLAGYQQVKTAILLKAKKPNMALTKELYPAVAEICGGQAEYMERTIRTAVKKAWRKRDPQVWQAYFPSRPNGSGKCPSNGTFISRLAECLRTGDRGR